MAATIGGKCGDFWVKTADRRPGPVIDLVKVCPPGRFPEPPIDQGVRIVWPSRPRFEQPVRAACLTEGADGGLDPSPAWPVVRGARPKERPGRPQDGGGPGQAGGRTDQVPSVGSGALDGPESAERGHDNLDQDAHHRKP